jgi:ABC-type multidrug transport system fused ATPase/permease subunit
MIKFNLNPNEQIVLVVRKHWIAIFGQIVALVLIAIVPLLLLIILPFMVPNFPGWQTGHLIYLYTFAYMVLLMFSWVTFFFSWTAYRLDVWVVTTHRIFLVEQSAMFHREISSLTLDKIQDLTIDIEGFLPTMLKFGDILLETAGERKMLKFINAKNPEAIKIAINSIQKDFYSRPLPVASVPVTEAGTASTAGAMGAPNAAQNVGD